MRFFASGPRMLGVRPGVILTKGDLSAFVPPPGKGGFVERQMRRTDIKPFWLRWIFKANVLAWAIVFYVALAALVFGSIMFVADFMNYVPKH